MSKTIAILFKDWRTASVSTAIVAVSHNHILL